MNALTTSKPASLLMDVDAFNQMQRVGKMLALSPLFPEHLRKGSTDTAIANGVLVMNMAMRLNEDPLTIAQAIYFVGGKPGWSSSYLIAKVNQHSVFKNPIDWKVEGQGETLSVTAFAELSQTGKKVSVTCDMRMAKAEGWTKNAKYQSMPEQMLRYRSATFLIRLYCPEVMVGVPSVIEHELEMKDVTPDYQPSRNAEHTITVQAEESDPEPEQSKPDQKSAAAKEPERAKESAPVEQKKPEQSKPMEERPSRHKKEEAASDGQLPLEGDQQDDEPEVDVERWSTLTDMICEEIGQSSADEVMEMYGPQIEQMKATPALKALAKRIDDALAAAQQ